MSASSTQSSFAKFPGDRQGTWSANCSGSPCADVSRLGKATYTQWLNKKGKIEADLTITKLEENRFLVVTAVATGARDELLPRHARPMPPAPPVTRCGAHFVSGR